MKLKNIFATVLILSSLASYSQIKIIGIVVDSLTQMPISDVSILCNNNGTISNELGEFEIYINNYPSTLVISHVSYKKKTIRINNEGFVRINFSLASIKLNEINIGDPALRLLKAAISKSLKDTSNLYLCKAYYQKISREGKNYTAIHEVLFDALWSQFGFKQWFPTNARFAKKTNIIIDSQNTISPVLANCGTLIENIFMPNSIRNDNSMYLYKLRKFINPDSENEIAEIAITPKNKSGNFFEGLIYIKINSDNILKIVGEFHNTDPIPRNLKKSFESFTITFKENDKNYPVLDNCIFSYNVTLKGFPNKKISEKAKVIVYEYLETNKKAKFKKINIQSDLVLIKKLPYNPKIWNENILKYTPIEREVISSFEREKLFLSNFIKNN